MSFLVKTLLVIAAKAADSAWAVRAAISGRLHKLWPVMVRNVMEVNLLYIKCSKWCQNGGKSFFCRNESFSLI